MQHSVFVKNKGKLSFRNSISAAFLEKFDLVILSHTCDADFPKMKQIPTFFAAASYVDRRLELKNESEGAQWVGDLDKGAYFLKTAN